MQSKIYPKGTRLRIVGNKTGHGLGIGSLVQVLTWSEALRAYRVQDAVGRERWCFREDVILDNGYDLRIIGAKL